jgi:hypothetical protein
MRTALTLVLLLAAGAAPALAQDAGDPPAAPAAETASTAIENYRRVTVTVYGNDPCPVAQSPDEIVVCARRPEEERYRLRTLTPPPGVPVEQGARIEQGGVGRTLGTDDVRLAGGTGTCTTVGPGGLTGCNKGINLLGLGEWLGTIIDE